MKILNPVKYLAVSCAASLAALILGAAVANAHHAFAAEFDREKEVDLTGTVTKVEWTNPHARFYVDAPDPELDNEVVNWNFELGSPNGLMRAGWRRDSLKPGDVISVSGWRARNNAHVANARSVMDADGKRLFAASSAEEEER
jgi:hypothetical protein